MTNLMNLSNRRVLVIDDNPAIHGDFKKIFASDSASETAMADAEASLFGAVTAGNPAAGFEIDSALQGQEGLERVRQSYQEGRPYAMAFVDIRMPPGWDGIETIAHIWAEFPDLQIVICTAYSDYSWDDMRAKLGQSDQLVILKKPFDHIEVLQLAQAMTRKWQLLQENSNHVAELEKTVAARTEELRKSEEQFRLITENAADLIAIVDAEGRRLYHSPSYLKLLGFSPEELKATSAFEQVHPEDRTRVITATRDTITTGSSQVLEYRMQHKDGSWRTVESHSAPFRNAVGTIEGVLLVARDIEDRKQAENERQLMEVQLRQAQKLEAIGQLAAGIAHEINTPTQYVGDNTRFLQDSFQSIQQVLKNHEALLQASAAGTLTPEMVANAVKLFATCDVEYLFQQIPAAIRETLEGVERVTKIVRAMKEFSHPGNKEKSPANLNQAIETTTTVAHGEWKYVADLKLDLDPDLPLVSCFIGEFNQTILNLIVNASHAIGDVVKQNPGTKGTITVSTRVEGGHAEVRISDTGTGIPEAVRPHIFEPFFTTKDVGKGTGQGLTIVYGNIVKKHGGTVSFETETGKGTTFILRLPLNAHSGNTQFLTAEPALKTAA